MNQRKAAIITGATSGIGKALAHELAGRGYDLGLTGRRQEVLEELEHALGEGTKVEVRTLDVTDTGRVRSVIPELAGALGGVGLIVANAGMATNGKVGTGNFEAEEETVRTNLLGGMATVDAAVALFRQAGGGQVVGISSVAAFRGMPGSAAYCASKAGFETYLEAVRAETTTDGITVTTLSPGFIDTPLNNKMKSRPFVIPVEKGATIIADLIERKVDHSTVPVFPWNVIGAAMRVTPTFLWNRAGSGR